MEEFTSCPRFWRGDEAGGVIVLLLFLHGDGCGLGRLFDFAKGLLVGVDVFSCLELAG